MNKAKKETTIDFHSLEFKQMTGTLGLGKPGIYLVRKNDILIKVSASSYNVHVSLYKYLQRCYQNNGTTKDKYTVAVITTDKSKEELTELADKLLKQWQHEALDDLYQEKILPLIKAKRDIPLDLLHWLPPYVKHHGKFITQVRGGRNQKVCVYKKKIWENRTVVYVIQKFLGDKLVEVYVGEAVKQAYQTFYNHFSPYPQDRTTLHYRTDYSRDLDTHEFKAAFIEIPNHNRNSKELKKIVRELENYLIIKWRKHYPISNKKVPRLGVESFKELLERPIPKSTEEREKYYDELYKVKVGTDNLSEAVHDAFDVRMEEVGKLIPEYVALPF